MITWGRKDATIDLYCYHKFNEQEWRFGGYKIESDQIDKLSIIDFKGLQFNAPKDIEKYLVGHYTDTWKTPIYGYQARGN